MTLKMANFPLIILQCLSGVIRTNRKFEWFGRIGQACYKNRGLNCEWFARIDSRESRCESPVPLTTVHFLRLLQIARKLKYPLTQNNYFRKIILKLLLSENYEPHTRNSLKMFSFLDISRGQNASKITKNNSQGVIFVIISCQRVTHVFLNRVQQTVSGNKPSQYPPDTVRWTLFRCSLRG